jgi:hypothetical protein
MSAVEKGRAARRKGKAGELEAVRIIREHGWPRASRSSRGTAQKGDVADGPAAAVIEIRRRESLSVPAAMREVMGRCEPHELPLLVHRRSNQPWLVTMELAELLPLLRLREQG